MPYGAIDRNLGSEFGESVPAVKAAVGVDGEFQ
jgi:hypothetical protein